MWSRFKNTLIADLRIMSTNAGFLAAWVILLLLIIFLKLLFRILSLFILSKTGFHLGNYYSLVAITLVSVIPFLFGVLYAFILTKEKALPSDYVIANSGLSKKKLLLMRLIATTLISFFLVLITIVLSGPVPSEGWLRTIFAAFLLSIQSPFILLFIVALEGKKISRQALSWLYCLFIIAVPLGLVFHHPWNYFLFYSPLYWTAWSWIIGSPVDSMIYGSIAVIMTSIASMLLLGYFLRRKSV
jgi:hypothetical protein